MGQKTTIIFFEQQTVEEILEKTEEGYGNWN